MAIHLAHVYGQENVVLITTDTRLVNLVAKRRREIPEKTKKRLKLDRTNDVAGKDFGPNLFPEAIHIGSCPNIKLEQTLGEWPLPIKRIARIKRVG